MQKSAISKCFKSCYLWILVDKLVRLKLASLELNASVLVGIIFYASCN